MPKTKEEYNLDRFFDLSIDMLCIAGVDGYFKKINKAFVSSLGWSKKTLLSKPFFDFVHNDDIEKTKKELDNLKKGSPTVSFENRYKTKSGKYKWLSWTSMPSDDSYLYSVARDVTTFKEREKELMRFKLAAENAYDHMVITDSNGIVLFANKAVERVTGFQNKEVLGTKAGVLWGGLMPKSVFVQLWDTIKNKKQVFKGELTNKRKDGVIYTAEAKITPILDENQEVEYFLGIERDVSETKQMLKMNELLINREVKMVELKKEVKRLNEKLNFYQSN